MKKTYASSPILGNIKEGRKEGRGSILRKEGRNEESSPVTR